MKNRRLKLVTVGAVMEVLCGASTSGAYRMQRDYVGIATTTPPAALVVEDAQQRRCGIDLSKGIPADGDSDNRLAEIPHSYADAQNIENDETGGGQNATSWFISIDDGGDQTYVANLTGMTTGIAKLGVDAGRPRQGVVKTFYTPVFVRKGLTRKLRVVFTPSQGFSLTVARVVEPATLTDSVKIGCDLNLISPAGVCRSLTAKADAVAASLRRGDKKTAEGQLNAFLNELKAQGEKHVRQPALTILREEAEALLNPPPPLSKPKVKSKTTTKAK